MEGDDSNESEVNEVVISIHSLRMEGDDIIPGTMTNIFYFNPLPPHGGRHCGTFLFLFCFNISIHSLRMEGDVKKHLFQGHELDISIHSLRMEGDSPVSCWEV